MSALDKVLRLAGEQPGTTLVEDPAGDLVLAARTAVREVLAYLADSGDDDEDDGGDDSHASHGTYKALVKRGMDKGKAASMCAKADKRVKAARLAEGALLALSALAVPEHDWVEATAAGPDLRLAQGAAYADTGHRGRQRYLVDTEQHTLLSGIYANLAAGYRPDELEAVQGRIAQARERFGIELTVDEIALAKKAMGDGGVIMNHAPFTGTHTHSHFQSNAHDHPHQHFGDNSHEGGPAHRPGSKPGGRAGW